MALATPAELRKAWTLKGRRLLRFIGGRRSALSRMGMVIIGVPLPVLLEMRSATVSHFRAHHRDDARLSDASRLSNLGVIETFASKARRRASATMSHLVHVPIRYGLVQKGVGLELPT
jgi:hypothetical protein